MLARRTQLALPDGQQCDLPLLIPSFSSKGFGLSPPRPRSKRLLSNATIDLVEFAQSANQAVLISGYDLHFRHFDDSSRGGSALDLLVKPRVVFLDSGGYELAPDFDSSEPKTPTYAPRSGYGLREYLKIIEQIANDPAHRSFVVSNFDQGTSGEPLSKQIESARRVFQKIGQHLSSFILKPIKASEPFIDAELSPKELKQLTGFHVIGVTEKELGQDVLDRLRSIARLRRGLDSVDIRAPIHVWGGLDPVMTPLYFFAGAQMFDGLSWLRYVYADGVAVNREAFPVLSDEYGISTNRDVCRQVISLKNLAMLKELSIALRKWIDGAGRDFSMFGERVRERLKHTYETMVTEIAELKEAQHGK